MIRDRLSSLGGGHAVSRLVEKSFRHWEVRHDAEAAQPAVTPPTARPFTVALSREAGIQGTSIGKEVGQLLGWHVYDHELVEQIAQELGLRTALLESVDERQQGWLRESIQSSLTSLTSGGTSPWVSETAFVHRLVETVHALGVHGECVIVGRGAAFILPAETTLRVRLIGPAPARIAALARQRGISEREAARQVRTIDRERNDFVRDHFLKDPSDPANYDLGLNVTRLSVSQAAEVIVETLHRLQRH
jgi:cytidylate kinase